VTFRGDNRSHYRSAEIQEDKKGETQEFKGPQKKQFEIAKRNAIIASKLNNPDLNLKEIASIVGVTHGYARLVWSKCIKGEVTTRGRPSLSIHVHGWFRMNHVPTEWYGRAPILRIHENEDGRDSDL